MTPSPGALHRAHPDREAPISPANQDRKKRDHPAFDDSSIVADRQALRRKRFLLATSTYIFGFVLLAMCAVVGLFPVKELAWMTAAFVAVNFGFFTALKTGWNLGRSDPSLTLPQLRTAVLFVFSILLGSPQTHFIAVPFYLALFVFAMLRLDRKALIRFEIFLLATYGAALVARWRLFGSVMDLRIETISAALVVVSSFWFTMAASYISDLRARLGDSLRKIEEQASRDGLTGVWNRRHIDLLLANELQRSARTVEPVCACLVDVDNFKSINDRFGHLNGDLALREIAAGLQRCLRPMDHLGRFGGEEFLVLLPATTLEEAAACAERLRLCVEALVSASGCGTLTISVGISTARPNEDVNGWISRADRALYEAKRTGRNRVVVEGAAVSKL